MNRKHLTSALAILAVSLSACGGDDEKDGADAGAAGLYSAALTGATWVRIDARGYGGMLCMPAPLGCQSGPGTIQYDLAAGTYEISDRYSTTLASSGVSLLGHITVSAAGAVTLDAAAQQYFDPPVVDATAVEQTTVLSLKVATVSYDAAGCPTTLVVFGVNQPFPMPLIKNRRYWLYTGYSYSTNPNVDVGGKFSVEPDFAVDDNGQVSLQGDLLLDPVDQRIFSTSGSTLTARPVSIHLDRKLYQGVIQLWGAGQFDAQSNLLVLRKRRYYLYGNYNSRIDDAGEGRFSPLPDLSISPDGIVNLLGTMVSKSFAATGTDNMFEAKTAPLTYQAATQGISLPLQAPMVTTGSTFHLLRNRRFVIFDQHSADLSDPNSNYFQPDHVVVDEDGALLPLGPSLARHFQLDPVQRTLTSIAATITVHRNGFTELLCISNHACSYNPEPLRANVIVGRRYGLLSYGSTNLATNIVVDADGNCSAAPIPAGAHNLTVECKLLRETGLSASGLVVDPAGFKGPICIGSAGCATGGNPSAPLILPVGTHTIGTQNSAEAESPDPALGTLAVNSNGTVLLSSSHFTTLDAQNRLVAITAPVEVAHAGYELQLIFMHSTDYHSGPQWQEQLITGRRYALASGNSQDMDDGGWMFSYGPDPHDIKVTDVGISLGPQTEKHFNAVTTAEGLRTLTAETLPVTIIHNGYPSLLAVGGGAYGWSPSWTTGLIVGRRYYMGAGYTWDLTRDSWILGFEPPYGLEVEVGQVRVLGDLAQRFFPSRVGDQHRVEAIVGTMSLTSSSEFAGTFCVQGANFPCGTGGGTRIDVPVIPGRRYFVTPDGSVPVKVEMNGLCPDTPIIQVTGGSVQVQCSPSPTAPGAPLDAPSGLTATVVSTDRVDLRWQDNAFSEDGFQVERLVVSEGTWALLAACNLGPLAITCSDTTGLALNETYRYRVYAHRDGLRSYSEEVTVRLGLPEVPVLTAVASADGTVSLNWTSSGGPVTGFRLERAMETGAFTEIATLEPEVRSHIDPGLSNGVYRYRIQATGNWGDSEFTDPVVVGVGALAPPTSLTASLDDWLGAIGPVHLQWVDNAASESGYRIYRWNGSNFALHATVTAFGGAGHFVDWVGQGQYAYLVRAFDGLGESAGSDQATVIVEPPIAPSLSGTLLANGTIRLDWSPLTNLRNAVIYRSVDGAPALTLSPVSSLTATSMVDSAVTSGHLYRYHVTVTNLLGSVSSEPVSVASSVLPVPPGALTAVVGSPTRIDLSWTNPSADLLHFVVERSTNNVDYTSIGQPGGALRQFSDPFAVALTPYWYRVRAVNIAGASAPSTTGPIQIQPPNRPTLLRATVASTTQINLSWTNDASIRTGIRVLRSPHQANAFQEIAPNVGANATSYNNSGLPLTTSFDYKVVAYNNGGDSPDSDVVRSRTGAVLAPTNFIATVISTTQINLAWTDVINEADYQVERRINSGSYLPIGPNPMDQNSTGLNVTGLNQNDTYAFRVRARNAVSPTPGWVTLTGLRTNAPAAPNQLTATALSGSRIRLNWRDNSTNETGFNVQRSVTGDTQGAWTQFVVGAGVTTYEDTGLSANTRYWYRVQAFNGANNISQFTLTAVAQTRGLCVSDPNGTLCAGTRCSGSVCQSGACVAAAPPNCNDSNACTADSCDPTLPTLCRNTPQIVGTSCSDGNACNGGEVCGAGGACLPGTSLSCDDARVCTVDSCSPATGCANTPVVAGTSCNDGNACTAGDVCDIGGTCVRAADTNCDDNNPCTADSCSAAGGCAHTPVAVGTTCSSATNLCMQAQVCGAGGTCGGGTPVSCDDGNECTLDSCDAATGCAHRPIAATDPNPPGACVVAIESVCIIPRGPEAFDAVFVYRNSSASNVTIPVGENNGFDDYRLDLGQPTLFETGQHGFTVSSPNGQTLSYTLGSGMREAIRTGETPTPTCTVVPGQMGDEVLMGDVRVALQIDAARALADSIMDTDVASGTLLTAGRTEGQFDVTSTGSAAYSVPLWTPPGRNGIQPSLALVYDSEGRTSTSRVGVAWKLAGFSEIRRCPLTRAEDGFPRPVSFNRDAFHEEAYCLDGKRLVQIATSGTTREYRTREDEFSRVFAHQATDQSVGSWEVQRRNGERWYYGSAENGNSKFTGTRVIGTANPADPDGFRQRTVQSGVVLAWGVDYIVDRYGNHSNVTYTSGELTFGDYGDIRMHHWRPTRIEYGGNNRRALPHDRAVVLTYTNQYPGLPQWTGGFATIEPFAIETIRMEGPGPEETPISPEGRYLLREYRLGYETSSATGRTRLRTVTECDGRGVCMRPTTFTWGDGSPNFTEIDTGLNVTPAGMENYWYLGVGDFDGNGADDFLYRRPAQASTDHGPFPSTTQREGWRIHMNSTLVDPEIAFASAEPWVEELQRTATLPDRGHLAKLDTPVIIDLDQDGKADIAAVKGATGAGRPAHWRFFRSSGGARPSFTWMEIDGDNDGNISPGENIQLVRRPPDPADRVRPIFAGDVDADGRLEIMAAMQTRPNENPQGTSWGWRGLDLAGGLRDYRSFGNYRAVHDTHVFSTDLNGDGIAELLFPWWDEREGALRRLSLVATNAANGSTSGPPWSLYNSFITELPFTTVDKQTQTLFADVNGDGLADILEISGSGGLPKVSLNGGSWRHYVHRQQDPYPADVVVLGGFADNVGNKFSMTAPDVVRENGVRVGDFDGDGGTDLILLDTDFERDTQRLGSRRGPVAWAARYDVQGDGRAVLRWTKHRLVIQRTVIDDVFIPPGVHTGTMDPTTIGERKAGFELSQVLDYNGDGLMDIAQVVGNTLKVYQREGTPPDMITAVQDGVGNRVSVDYSSIAGQFNPHYSGDVDGPGCAFPQNCSRRGRWVVARHKLDNGSARTSTDDGAWQNVVTHRYESAVTNLDGEGFLGFRSHTMTDERTGTTTTTRYDLNFVDDVRLHFRRGRPSSTETTVTLPDRRLVQRTTTMWSVHMSTEAPSGGPKIYAVRPDVVVDTNEEVLNSGVRRELSWTSTVRTYQNYFNETSLTVERRGLPSLTGGGQLLADVYRRTTTYQPMTPADRDRWLLDRVDQVTETSTTPGSTRRRQFDVETDPDTGALTTVTRLPTDEENTRRTTEIVRDVNSGFVTHVHNYSDARLRTTRFVPDDTLLFPREVFNAEGHRTQVVHHPGYGVLGVEIDPNRVTTAYRYDRFLRNKETRNSRGAGVDRLYEHVSDVAGAMGIEERRLGGGETHVILDRLLRPIDTRQLHNSPMPGTHWSQVVREYYPEGWLRSVTEPGTVGVTLPKTTYVYDAAGRITSVTDPGDKVTTTTYDGRTVTTTDPNGHENRAVMDFAGRLWRSEARQDFTDSETSHVTTQYRYGAFDLVEAVTVAGWEMQVSVYDMYGRRKSVTTPDRGLRTFEYNEFDEVVRERDAAGNNIRFVHDGLGRVEQRINDVTNQTSTFLWDDAPNGIGQIASTTSFEGLTTGRTYDVDAQLRTETTNFGPGRSATTTYGYDAFGRMNSIGYPAVNGSSLTVGYSYDPLSGILHSAFDSRTPQLPFWSVEWRDARGLLFEERLGHNMLTQRRYDPRGLLRDLDTRLAGVSDAERTIQNLEYGYYDNGNVWTRRDINLALTETFSYDLLNRLHHWSPGSSGTATYTYDSLGTLMGRESSNGLALPNVTFTPNVISGASGPPFGIHTAQIGSETSTYTYDAAGNQTSGGGRSLIRYTLANLPRAIHKQTGEVTTFQYDASDGRIVKAGPNGTTEYHASLYERRVERAPGSPERTTHVFHVMAERPIADVIWEEGQSERVLYLHQDVLGSLETITDADGNILEDRKYDPFGRRVTRSDLFSNGGSLTQSPRDGFTGHEEDDDLGLVNMQGRIYDPKQMRFLTTDPVVSNPLSGQSYHPYAYAFNNPLNFIDPSGFANCPSQTAGEGNGGNGCNQITPGLHPRAIRDFFKSLFRRKISVPDFWGGSGGGAPNSPPTVDDSSRKIFPVVPGSVHYRNMVARNFDEQGLTFLAQLAERNAGCVLCHIHHGLGGYVTDDMVNADAFNSWVLAAFRARAAVELFTMVGGFAEVAAMRMGTVAKNTEVFYRTMKSAHYEDLLLTGRLPASVETFISTTEAFSQSYSGVLVEFRVAAGTTQSLAQMGVRDASALVRSAYPNMSRVGKGWAASKAFFKAEGGQINIGLGKGGALDLFNNNIQGFNVISR